MNTRLTRILSRVLAPVLLIGLIIFAIRFCSLVGLTYRQNYRVDIKWAKTHSATSEFMIKFVWSYLTNEFVFSEKRKLFTATGCVQTVQYGFTLGNTEHFLPLPWNNLSVFQGEGIPHESKLVLSGRLEYEMSPLLSGPLGPVQIEWHKIGQHYAVFTDRYSLIQAVRSRKF